MASTKRGVYHNLRESIYSVSNSEIEFFFSSRVTQKRFLEGYKKAREKFKCKIDKLGVSSELNVSTLSDIIFYKKVEYRGFFASVNGVEILWRDLNKYALRKMTEKNTKDWHEKQKVK